MGLFSLLNVASCLLNAATGNMNIWWIDLTALNVTLSGSTFHLGFIIEGLAGIAMVVWAIAPTGNLAQRIITAVLIGVLAVVALLNAFSYWQALFSGQLYFALPVPLSLVIALALGFCAVRILKSDKSTITVAGVVACILVCAICAAGFPLLQTAFFGTTDYRRDADVAVVFGARVFEDGTLSKALRERMDTAIELYNQGYVDKLIVSGGIEEGDIVDEAQAMYEYAVAAGVPSDDVLTDRYGNSTTESVDNTISLCRSMGYSTIIATSSFYHMPRIKLLYNLQSVDVLTVPTVGDVMGNGTLISIWREIPAWWFYWFEGSF